MKVRYNKFHKAVDLLPENKEEQVDCIQLQLDTLSDKVKIPFNTVLEPSNQNIWTVFIAERN